MIIHDCAGTILVRQNSTPGDGYVHLSKCFGAVHSFSVFAKRKTDMARHVCIYRPTKNYGYHLYMYAIKMKSTQK